MAFFYIENNTVYWVAAKILIEYLYKITYCHYKTNVLQSSYSLSDKWGKELQMNKRNIEKPETTQREQIEKYIIQAIRQMDDQKLRNIYHFIMHIK